MNWQPCHQTLSWAKVRAQKVSKVTDPCSLGGNLMLDHVLALLSVDRLAGALLEDHRDPGIDNGHIGHIGLSGRTEWSW